MINFEMLGYWIVRCEYFPIYLDSMWETFVESDQSLSGLVDPKSWIPSAN